MKHIRSIILSLLIILPISLTPVSAEEKSRLMGVIIASCLNLDVMKLIAKADETSKEEATSLFKKYSMMGVCGRYPTPRIAPLEKMEMTYNDHAGVKSEIWKIKDMNMWSIIDPRRIENVPIYKKTKKLKA